MKKETINIGCSSYATPSWQTLFYPEGLPKKQWFEFYTQHFNTYELNATFYRFPTVKSLHSWYEKTPDKFQFSVKIPKTITHIKKLVGCSYEVEKFYNVISEGLKEKLACVLFQFPPSFSYSPERLEAIINTVNPKFNNVIEFRHETWWRQDAIDILSANNIIFCSVNYPTLPTTIIKTSETGYVRMHGNPKLFYSEYPPETIESLYKAVQNQNFKFAYIYFNNTASTGGIINALQAKDMQNKL